MCDDDLKGTFGFSGALWLPLFQILDNLLALDNVQASLTLRSLNRKFRLDENRPTKLCRKHHGSISFNGSSGGKFADVATKWRISGERE